MKNSDYWKHRQELLQDALMKKADKIIPEMEAKYNTAIRNIEGEIQLFYQRFADNEGLKLADAKKLLNSDERKAFQMELDEYIQKGMENGISEDWSKQLESASDIYRMDRLKMLQMQMREQVEELAGYKQQALDKTLGEINTEGYYRNIFEIQQMQGYGEAFTILDTNRINKILSKPWTYDSMSYSDKIWKNKDTLSYVLDKALTQGIVRGDTPGKIADIISKKIGVELNNAKRLVLTESAAFSAMSAKDSYNELDVERFEYMATLDERTCETCGPMDGKVFKIPEYDIGVTVPPLHPNCRCTTVPYFNDEFTVGETRTARSPDGKVYDVSTSMKYSDWYDQNVKGNPNMVFKEKIRKNQYTDQKQYQNYRNVLGNDAPNSFDKFQKMKYNNNEEWKYLKLDYVRRNKLLENPDLALPNADSVIIADEKFTKYLFNPENQKGFAKGKAFTDRLGYNIDNYTELKKRILQKATIYPVLEKGKTDYGTRYEQKIVLFGKKGAPANTVVGWIEKDGQTKLTSTYIKEVKLDED